MKLPKLYKKSVKGAVQQWEISTDGNSFYTEAGQVDGKITKSLPTYTEPKNLGKANETTAEQQAEIEALAKWEKKKKEGYVENLEDVDNETFIKPMLAHPIKNRKTPFDYPVIMNKKYNGCRCIITKDGAFSRKGEKFHNVKHILEELQPVFEQHPNLVLDGELNDPNDQKNLNRLIKLIAVTRKEKDLTPELIEESKNIVKYCIYDFFHKGFQEHPYETRLVSADMIFKYGDKKYSYVYMVDYQYANSEEEVAEFTDKVISDGWEGAILRVRNMPYEHKRSMNLLKIKKFEDAEFEVVDIMEGTGNWTGKAKQIVCKLNNKGDTFISNVRGTMEFLEDVLKNKKDYIGKKITVDFQCYSEYGVPLLPYTNLLVRNYE